MEGKEENKEEVKSVVATVPAKNLVDGGEVKIKKGKYTRNRGSPFLAESKTWETMSEAVKIPEDLIKGIVDGNEFLSPSKI
jgi:hypothetical protein